MVMSSANSPIGTLLMLGKAAECCFPKRKPRPRARQEAMSSFRAQSREATHSNGDTALPWRMPLPSLR
eukprot:15192886-Alexandrium_andersonii.AAC.1